MLCEHAQVPGQLFIGFLVVSLKEGPFPIGGPDVDAHLGDMAPRR